MRSWAFPLLPILLLSLRTPLLAGDTTYSDTRSVPRESSSSNSSTDAPAGSGDSDDDSDDDTWSISFRPDGEDSEDKGGRARPETGNPRDRLFVSCLSPDDLHSMGEAGLYVVTLPLRMGFCFVFDNFRQSHVDLFSGSADMEALPQRPWRLGFGFGLGGLYMPGAAGGVPIGLHAEALRALSAANQIRFRAGMGWANAGSWVDYERAILVDGNPVGVQRDSLSDYSQKAFPLTVEGLWTGPLGLYLLGGGGASILNERIDYLRSQDAGASWELRNESRLAIRPLLTLGVGRFASRDGGRRFQRFEIRYQAAFLLPDRRSSFPGDNAMAVHSLTWDWAWLW